jgi:hypothetical protein
LFGTCLDYSGVEISKLVELFVPQVTFSVPEKSFQTKFDRLQDPGHKILPRRDMKKLKARE